MIIGRRVDVLGLWGMGFLCWLVWLLVFSEIEWVKKEASEILQNFQENTAGVATISFFNSALEFSCLSNQREAWMQAKKCCALS